MVSLEGLDLKVVVLLDSSDALKRSLSSSHSSDIRYTVLDSSLTDIAVVVDRGLAGRSIDNKLDLAVCDLVSDMGAG